MRKVEEVEGGKETGFYNVGYISRYSGSYNYQLVQASSKEEALAIYRDFNEMYDIGDESCLDNVRPYRISYIKRTDSSTKPLFYEFQQRPDFSEGILQKLIISEDKGIGEFVLIEAYSAEDANRKMKEIFPECFEKRSKESYLHAFYWARESNSSKKPKIKTNSLDKYMKGKTYGELIFIHYLDGTVKKIQLP